MAGLESQITYGTLYGTYVVHGTRVCMEYDPDTPTRNIEFPNEVVRRPRDILARP